MKSPSRCFVFTDAVLQVCWWSSFSAPEPSCITCEGVLVAACSNPSPPFPLPLKFKRSAASVTQGQTLNLSHSHPLHFLTPSIARTPSHTPHLVTLFVWRLTQALLDREGEKRKGMGAQKEMRSRRDIFSQRRLRAKRWVSWRWGSGGVCCHGSRAGPPDSLVWCGRPPAAAGSLRCCDSHCRVSDRQCPSPQRRRRQAFTGPDNGQAGTRLPLSQTLIMAVLSHTFVGALYLFNRWRGLFLRLLHLTRATQNRHFSERCDPTVCVDVLGFVFNALVPNDLRYAGALCQTCKGTQATRSKYL